MSARQPAVSYYVPGEIIYGFEVQRAPAELWRKPWFESQQALADYLTEQELAPDPKRFRFARDKVPPAHFQTILPIAGQPERSTVLAKLQLVEAAELPAVIKMASQGIRDRRGDLVMVTPNWWGGMSQTHGGTGGPGDKPKPALIQTAHACEFDIPGLAAVIQDAIGHTGSNKERTPGPIDVYVLDTIPPRRTPRYKELYQLMSGGAQPQAEVLDAQIINRVEYDKHPFGRAVKHGLLRQPDNSWKAANGDLSFTWIEAMNPLVFDELYDPPGHPNGHPRYFVKDSNPASFDEPYDASDHGTFITGIIQQIAPQARIHVIEVLNRYGIGTIESVVAGFERIAQLRSADPERRPYVVNCSFTFAAPVLDEAKKGNVTALHDLPATDALHQWVHDPALQPVMHAAIRRLFETMMPSLHAIGEALPEDAQDVLVIAAAGNDSDVQNGIRFNARYPANVRSVLGVGALTRDVTALAIANFSNVSDQPASDGLVTVGEIQGVFTQPFPPASIGAPQTTNHYGFAQWPGTSFATGVITGCVARICSEVGVRPHEALQFLRGHTSPAASGEAGLVVAQPNALFV